MLSALPLPPFVEKNDRCWFLHAAPAGATPYASTEMAVRYDECDE